MTGFVEIRTAKVKNMCMITPNIYTGLLPCLSASLVRVEQPITIPIRKLAPMKPIT